MSSTDCGHGALSALAATDSTEPASSTPSRSASARAVVAGLGRTDRHLSERDRYVLDLVTPGLEDALRAAAGASAPHTALGAASPARTAVLLPDR